MANEESMDARTAEELLRRFEPVIRFTKGEWFYPMDSEPYVDACSLWVARPGEEAACVVPAGELTLDRLAQQPEDTTGAVHYLKIPNPKEDGDQGRRRSKRSHTNPDWPKETFHAGRGRLARVGYLSRLADALFSLTLLARGRVPGGRRGGGPGPVRPLHGERGTFHVPRERGQAGRLDRIALLALLRVQRLEEQRLRRQRPRVRLGEDLHLPLRVGSRRGTPRVGGLRRARGDRRRSEAPVGRPRVGEDRRAPRGVRLLRLARNPLLPGRVPDRARFPLAPRHLRGQEDPASLLVRDAAPVR